MKELPSFGNYGQYSSDNYGAHTLKFYMGTMTLYYSYKTIVAYHDYQDGLIVSKNVWSVTTGKHLNWIDRGNKKARLDNDVFQEKLQDALERHIN